MMRPLCVAWAFLAWAVTPGRSVVSVGELFTDHCVLQTNYQYGARAFIFGRAAPGESVAVQGAFGGAYRIKATHAGRSLRSDVSFHGGGDTARPRLKPYQGFQRFDISIVGKANRILLRNVRYGEVYLCASGGGFGLNMSSVGDRRRLGEKKNFTVADHRRLGGPRQSGVPGAAAAVAEGGSKVSLLWAGSGNGWAPVTRANLAAFPAVCVLAERAMRKVGDEASAHRAVGLISLAMGGATSQGLGPWAPGQDTMAACEGDPKAPKKARHQEGTPWASLVAPLAGFSLRAVLWFDASVLSGGTAADAGAGTRSEVTTAARFGCEFPKLVRAWRVAWRIGHFSFVFAELPSPSSSSSAFDVAEFRAAQARALPVRDVGEVATTGLAVTYDLGDLPSSSSPQASRAIFYKTLADRLAATALHVAVAAPTKASGPALRAPPELRAADSHVILKFDHAAALRFGALEGCSACCDDGATFELLIDGVWAHVASFAHTGSTGVLLAPKKPKPAATAVRYAWRDRPQCALYNDRNLPASPFQVDIIPDPSTPDATAAAATTTTTTTRFVPDDALPPAPLDASTPPMGINSWNFFHCNVDEHAVLATADALIATGLARAGYRYVNVEDCWQVNRDRNGDVRADNVRFPSGLDHLADRLHAKGMLFGLHTSATSLTSQHRPGSLHREVADARRYCAFGIDYLKIDLCGGARGKERDQWAMFRAEFDACRDRTGRFVFQSVEYCRTTQGCGAWIAHVANAWRTTKDVQANWRSVLANADATEQLHALAGPGHWNDPDMLQVGNVGLDVVEAQSHFSLWCMLAAPLIIGTDVTHLDAAFLAILKNEALIAVNQDPLGFQGRKLTRGGGPLEMWYKTLLGGATAVLFLNRNDRGPPTAITLPLRDLRLPLPAYEASDLWTGASLGLLCRDGVYTAKGVGPHAVAVIRLDPPTPGNKKKQQQRFSKAGCERRLADEAFPFPHPFSNRTAPPSPFYDQQRTKNQTARVLHVVPLRKRRPS